MYISELVEILWTYFVSSLRTAGAKEGPACFSFRTFVLRSIQAKPEKALISLFEACAQETTLPLGSGLLLVWWGSGALGTSWTEAVEDVHRGALCLYTSLTVGHRSVLLVGGWQRGQRAVLIREFSVKVSFLQSEREKWISHINTYMWNLGKWYVLAKSLQSCPTPWTVAR